MVVLFRVASEALICWTIKYEQSVELHAELIHLNIPASPYMLLSPSRFIILGGWANSGSGQYTSNSAIELDETAPGGWKYLPSFVGNGITHSMPAGYTAKAFLD